MKKLSLILLFSLGALSAFAQQRITLDLQQTIALANDSSLEAVCRTVNSFVPRTDTAERTSGGIGLANLRRRLQLIYGGKASLKISVKGDIYRACLQIPLGAGDADVLPDIPCQSDKTDTI